MRILGLDEAGRGCVLGPLVVGAFVFDGADQAALRAAGAADSKVLTAEKRAIARERLRALGEGRVVAIPATRIDEANLNELEISAFIGLVQACSPDRVYLDAPVNPRGIPALSRRLAEQTGVRDWVVEPKADATWPVVGAASIWAKLARDEAIEALGAVGSGYPSDPVTREYLRGLLASGLPLPEHVRTRWGTLDVLRQQGLWR
jgi:ribonuclease HII